MKMSNMLHIAVDHEGAILKLKSVRSRGGTGTKYKELVPSCSSSACFHHNALINVNHMGGGGGSAGKGGGFDKF